MTKKEVELYTLLELKEVLPNEKFIKIFEKEQEKEVYFLQECYWWDFKEDLPMIEEVLSFFDLEMSFNNNNNDCATVETNSIEIEDPTGVRAYEKLLQIIIELKAYKCYNWCLCDIIHFLEENQEDLIKKNISLCELLEQSVNYIINNINYLDLNIEEVSDTLECNEEYFLKNGCKININNI